MASSTYKNIVEGKFDTTQMTKAERDKQMNAMFKKIKDCMKHNADKNERPVFIVLVAAGGADKSDQA